MMRPGCHLLTVLNINDLSSWSKRVMTNGCEFCNVRRGRLRAPCLGLAEIYFSFSDIFPLFSSPSQTLSALSGGLGEEITSAEQAEIR